MSHYDSSETTEYYDSDDFSITSADERRVAEIKRNAAAAYESVFAAMCASLRVKDPSVTVVSRTDTSIRRPVPLTNQRARLLGETLQGNSHEIADCVEEGGDEDHDSLAPLLGFVSESRALQKVCLEGDGYFPTHYPLSILRRSFLAIGETQRLKTCR
jgi:hypothetical protein